MVFSERRRTRPLPFPPAVVLVRVVYEVDISLLRRLSLSHGGSFRTGQNHTERSTMTGPSPLIRQDSIVRAGWSGPSARNMRQSWERSRHQCDCWDGYAHTHIRTYHAMAWETIRRPNYRIFRSLRFQVRSARLGRPKCIDPLVAGGWWCG